MKPLRIAAACLLCLVPRLPTGQAEQPSRSRPRRFWLAVALLSLLAPLPIVAQNFHGCPPEGDGGDSALNRLKNRTELPQTVKSEHLDDLLVALPAYDEIGKKHREKWPDDDRAEIELEEKRAVQVVGYLIASKREGPESSNCHLDQDRDYHLWLTNSPDDDKSAAIVVEITPRVAVHHANWASTIGALAKNNRRVRITGWLLFDQEHPEQVGKTRATRWEIHPVTKIEVWSKPGGKPGKWMAV